MKTFDYYGETIEFDGTVSDLFTQIMDEDGELPAEFEYQFEDASVLDAYLDLMGTREIETMEDLRAENKRCQNAYMGQYSSHTDFARDEFERACSEPNEWWADFLNFEAMGEALMADYIESNGYYFNPNVV